MNPTDSTNSFTNVTSNWKYDPENWITAYHGTNQTFNSPMGTRFNPDSLFGPAYYLTSDPRIASSYSTARPNSMFDDLHNHGPQVRPTSIPKNLNLLDVEGRMDPSVIYTLYRAADSQGVGQAFKQNFAAVAGTHRDNITYQDLRTAIRDTFGADKINEFLSKAGYDGVKYNGGMRIPIGDENGNPITHDAYAIFSESMNKIRNKLTGQVGGWNDLGFGKDLTGGTTSTAGPNLKPPLPQEGFTPKDPTVSSPNPGGFSPLPGFLQSILPGMGTGFTPKMTLPQEGFSPLPTFLQQILGNRSNATT